MNLHVGVCSCGHYVTSSHYGTSVLISICNHLRECSQGCSPLTIDTTELIEIGDETRIWQHGRILARMFCHKTTGSTLQEMNWMRR